MTASRLVTTLVGTLLTVACSSEYGRVTTPASTQAPSETSAPCVLALTLGTTEFSAAGGTTTGRITANRADCAWTVQAPAWASVVPASGTGTADMVVTVSVADGARAGVVTLGATQVTIQQVAPMPVACAVTLAMSDAHVPAGGGAIEGAIVATRSDCDWTVLASDWLSVSPERGRGSGTVVVSVPPSAQDARSGEVYLDGQRSGRVEIRQDGAPEGDRLGFTLLSCGEGTAGSYVPLACVAEVKPGANPSSTGIRVSVDRSPLGGPSDAGLALFMGSYDMDLTVPPGTPAGPIVLTFTVTDREGRRATQTATFMVR